MGNRKNGNTSDKELIDISSDDDQRKLDQVPSKKDAGLSSEVNERPRKRPMYQNTNSTEQQPRDQTNFSPSEVKLAAVSYFPISRLVHTNKIHDPNTI